MLKTILIALVLCLVRLPAVAESYPQGTIRIIVGFGPGTAPDVAARAVADAFTAAWGKAAVVENIVGAGGNLAADRVAKAPPDGYTLLMAGNAAIVINPSLYAKLPFDPASDLVPITMVTRTPNILAATNDLPVRSAVELAELARQKPGKLTFASAGLGTSTHLAGELFKTMAGVEMQHVPYRDNAALMTDLVTGRVDVFFGSIASVLPQVRAGKLKALAVTSLQRSPAAPELPTLDEAGFKGFESTAWFGLMAPSGTPPAIVSQLHTEAARVARVPAVAEKFRALGMEPVGNSSSEFSAVIKSEAPVWRDLIQKVGIKPIE